MQAVWLVTSFTLAVVSAILVGWQVAVIAAELAAAQACLIVRQLLLWIPSPPWAIAAHLHRLRLARQLRDAVSHEAWQAAARALDEVDGGLAWREAPESDLFDAALVARTTEALRAARKRGDAPALMSILRSAVARGYGGVDSPLLYSRARTGTKRVIERFFDEVCRSLDAVAAARPAAFASAVSLSTLEAGGMDAAKAEFFEGCRVALGRTAVALSGGGSLAMAHMGVVRTLLSAGLLPRVIAGTSGGSIVAAMLAVHRDEELMRDILVPTVVQLHGPSVRFFDPLPAQLWRFVVSGLTMGAPRLMESDTFANALRAYFGQHTFASAFARTGRIVCIAVSTSYGSGGIGFAGVPGGDSSVLADGDGGTRGSHSSLVLNYLTAPHVLLYSAVAASCAAPGLMRPVTLMALSHHGREVPYHPVPGVHSVDGSVAADIPAQSLALMFHANRLIVSQTNPHIVPFMPSQTRIGGTSMSSGGGAGGGGGGSGALTRALATVEYALQLDIRARAKFLAKLRLLPRLFGADMSQLLLQRYSGDVTIVPRQGFMSQWRALSQPSVADMRRFLMSGAQATWPALPHIRSLVVIEKKLSALARQYAASAAATGVVPAPRRAIALAGGSAATSSDEDDGAREAAPQPSVGPRRRNGLHLPNGGEGGSGGRGFVSPGGGISRLTWPSGASFGTLTDALAGSSARPAHRTVGEEGSIRGRARPSISEPTSPALTAAVAPSRVATPVGGRKDSLDEAGSLPWSSEIAPPSPGGLSTASSWRSLTPPPVDPTAYLVLAGALRVDEAQALHGGKVPTFAVAAAPGGFLVPRLRGGMSFAPELGSDSGGSSSGVEVPAATTTGAVSGPAATPGRGMRIGMELDDHDHARCDSETGSRASTPARDRTTASHSPQLYPRADTIAAAAAGAGVTPSSRRSVTFRSDVVGGDDDRDSPTPQRPAPWVLPAAAERGGGRSPPASPGSSSPSISPPRAAAAGGGGGSGSGSGDGGDHRGWLARRLLREGSDGLVSRDGIVAAGPMTPPLTAVPRGGSGDPASRRTMSQSPPPSPLHLALPATVVDYGYAAGDGRGRSPVVVVPRMPAAAIGKHLHALGQRAFAASQQFRGAATAAAASSPPRAASARIASAVAGGSPPLVPGSSPSLGPVGQSLHGILTNEGASGFMLATRPSADEAAAPALPASHDSNLDDAHDGDDSLVGPGDDTFTPAATVLIPSPFAAARHVVPVRLVAATATGRGDATASTAAAQGDSMAAEGAADGPPPPLAIPAAPTAPPLLSYAAHSLAGLSAPPHDVRGATLVWPMTPDWSPTAAGQAERHRFMARAAGAAAVEGGDGHSVPTAHLHLQPHARSALSRMAGGGTTVAADGAGSGSHDGGGV